MSRSELYLTSGWSLCPDASWFDVMFALDTAQEITLAEKIRKRFSCGQKVKQSSIELCEIEFSSDEEDQIINKLEDLHLSYTQLFIDVRECIEELVESNKIPLHKLAAKIEDAQIHSSLRGLSKCKLITDVFDAIRDHCNFLDCSTLVGHTTDHREIKSFEASGRT